jgi:hypothetical protein
MGVVENMKDVADIVKKFNDIDLNRRILDLEGRGSRWPSKHNLSTKLPRNGPRKFRAFGQMIRKVRRTCQ